MERLPHCKVSSPRTMFRTKTPTGSNSNCQLGTFGILLAPCRASSFRQSMAACTEGIPERSRNQPPQPATPNSQQISKGPKDHTKPTPRDPVDSYADHPSCSKPRCLHMHTCIHAYVHTCRATSIYACMHTCVHTYVYLHTYVYFYVYIYRYSCIYASKPEI